MTQAVNDGGKTQVGYEDRCGSGCFLVWLVYYRLNNKFVSYDNKKMSWLILALIIPITVACLNGSTYSFAFSVFGFGVLSYFTNIFLIRYFIKRRAPSTLEDDSWEVTAGTGIVPKWVSALGLVGIGLIPSGLIVAILLWLGVVANKAL